MTICKRVVYSGRVQGVGFRYTAKGLADRYPVTGYVRNLPSGDVELAAEGEAEQVDAFLAAVAGQMASYIRTTAVHEETLNHYRGFGIRY